MNSVTFFLTGKSIWRKGGFKLRFDYCVMILGIIISVAVVTATISLFEGYQQTLKQVLLDTNSHLIIYPGVTTNLTPEKAEQVKLLIGRSNKIKSIQPVLVNTAIAQSKGKVRSCLLKGYEQFGDTFWFEKYAISGNKKPAPGSILLGDRLMKDLGTAIGDTISLMYPMTQGVSSFGIVPMQKQFKVSGAVRTGYYEMDKALVILTDYDAFSFYHTPPMYSYLEVSLTDKYIDKADDIEAIIANKLGHEFTIKTWVEYNGNLFSLISMEKWLIFLVFSFLVLIAAMNCVSIVSTTIIERKKEIAILRTIGMTLSHVSRVIFFRIMSVCTASTLAGIALGLITSWLITKQSLYQLKGSVYFIDVLSTNISALNIIVIFILTLAFISICIRMPLRRINDYQIVDILRGR